MIIHPDRFSDVINGVTVLGPSILETEILMPIYAAISLVGLHILKRFHNLILNKDFPLLFSFPKLFEKLNSTFAKDMLLLNQRFKYWKSKHFKNALSNSELFQNLIRVAQAYSTAVYQLISLLLKKFAYGFEYQKGAIFGFGKNTSDNTWTALK